MSYRTEYDISWIEPDVDGTPSEKSIHLAGVSVIFVNALRSGMEAASQISDVQVVVFNTTRRLL